MKVDKYADPPDLYALEKGLFLLLLSISSPVALFKQSIVIFFAVP